jgi:hypothetical protein
MKRWNISRNQIPHPKEEINFSNISIMEHPHGGLIGIFCYEKSTFKNAIFSSTFYYDEHKEIWAKQRESLEFTPSYNFSQSTFLNMMGNLQMIYCLDHQLLQYISNDYGKTWKQSDSFLEDSVAWRVRNPPVFVGMGRVLLPIYDEDSGRSFAYISDDIGKHWFPSVFIEPSDDLLEISDPEDVFSHKIQFPSFTQAGERKIVCFMILEKRGHLLQSVSNDFGETWLSAVETNILSEEGEIQAIRLRDSNGHYIPTVVLLYNHKKDNGKISVNLAISSDIGETWDDIVEVDEIETVYTGISVIQTMDNKLHIIYSSKQGVNHLIVHDFIGI